jgi:hypothetical protein
VIEEPWWIQIENPNPNLSGVLKFIKSFDLVNVAGKLLMVGTQTVKTPQFLTGPTRSQKIFFNGD